MASSAFDGGTKHWVGRQGKRRAGIPFLLEACRAGRRILWKALSLVFSLVQYLWLIVIYAKKASCFLYGFLVPATLEQSDDTLLREIKGAILEYVDYEQVFQMILLSKGWKLLIESVEFLSIISSKKQPSFTACYLFIRDGALQSAGFDPAWSVSGDGTSVGKWRRLPPLSFLPTNCTPDPDLFKEFLICANNGLVCMNFSKSSLPERLIVFNPLARSWKELPPLLHRRNPVLMHMIVDKATQSYQILVAGSSWDDQEQHPSTFTDTYVPRMDQQEHLSKITELYDSRTGQWARVGDLPGPAYALSEFQAGVFQNDNILCIGFMKHNNEVVKGILGFNVVERTWSTYLGLPHSSILQLVENDGQLYLFTERIEDFGEFDDHCVDRVEWTPLDGDIPFKLVNVFRTPKIGGWSLDVFPEYALLPYSKSRLCIFNTVDRTGEIFDVVDRERSELLPAPAIPEDGELRVCTLNPMSFTLEPRFGIRA